MFRVRSRTRAKQLGSVVVGSGVAGGGSSLYDARYGTDTATAASTGWFTFGLKSGCRRIWVDSSKADDTGDGLTAATAKKTLMAAWTLFTNGSWTSGDQLMLAGTGSRTYADDGTSSGWYNVPGVSAVYPTTVLSYDPADAANTAKYGKLMGPNRPRFTYTNNGSNISVLGNGPAGPNGDHGYFAVQGLIIDGQGADANSIGVTAKHDGTIWQNCQFKEILLVNDNAASAHGLSAGANVSKCGFYGSWRSANGNTQGMFTNYVDGLWLQDCTFAHCGWKIGASRDDPTANGGNSVFGHASYYAASNVNGRYDRCVFIDSASDGWNLRGSAGATQLVSFDEPTLASFTGYSSTYLDNPAGSIVTVDDFCAIGGADIWSAAATASKGDGQRGQGASATNARAGSYLNNGVMFDNPKYSSGNGYVFAITNSNLSQINQVVNVSNVRAHNYSAIAQSMFYQTGGAAKVQINWSNCLLDTLAGIGTGGATTISGSGVRTWVGADYSTALTKAQVITALGFSTKADMVNAMLEYPHLAWAQAVLGIVFPAYNAIPQYSTASVPSLAGLTTPTVVYKTTLGTLTIATLNFARGTASSSLMSGCSANFVLSSSDLPSGFTILGRSLVYDGTGSGAATPTIHILETNSDGAGTNTTPFTLSIS